MFQIQRFLLPAIQPLVAGNQAAVDPDLNVVRIGFHCGALSTVPAGNGILVGLHNDGGVTSDCWVEFLRRIQRIPWDSVKLLPFFRQHLAN